MTSSGSAVAKQHERKLEAVGSGTASLKRNANSLRRLNARGFFKIPVTGIRPNVVNVYRLWCAADGRDFILKGGPAF